MNILAIDSNHETLFELCDKLDMLGCYVCWATSIKEALALGDWSRFAVILLDINLPDAAASELVPQIRSVAPAVPVLVLAEHTQRQRALAALRGGAVDCVWKPVDPPELGSCLSLVVRTRQLGEIPELRRMRLASVARSTRDSPFEDRWPSSARPPKGFCNGAAGFQRVLNRRRRAGGWRLSRADAGTGPQLCEGPDGLRIGF